MEKLIDNEKDIWFSCGCRHWRITLQDEKGVTNQPENTTKDHECEKITVWRTTKGIKRYFKKNI